jgi:hypothetical protein
MPAKSGVPNPLTGSHPVAEFQPLKDNFINSLHSGRRMDNFRTQWTPNILCFALIIKRQ